MTIKRLFLLCCVLCLTNCYGCSVKNSTLVSSSCFSESLESIDAAFSFSSNYSSKVFDSDDFIFSFSSSCFISQSSSGCNQNNESEMPLFKCDCCNRDVFDKNYYSPHICNECNNKLCETDLLNYLFITDLHIDSDEQMEKVNLLINDVVDYVNESDLIDFLCIGGDLTTLYFDKKTDYYLWYQQILFPLSLCNKPVLILNGNHDDNSNPGWTDSNSIQIISPNEYIDHVQKTFINVEVKYDSENAHSKYYYYDIEKNNTKYRIVCLDSCDRPDSSNNGYYWGYSFQQIQWLLSIAPTNHEHKLVILSHMSVEEKYNACQKEVAYSKEMTEAVKRIYSSGDVLIHSFGHLHLNLFEKSNYGLVYSCTPTLFSGGLDSRFDGQTVYSQINDDSIGVETVDKTKIDYSYNLFSLGNGFAIQYSLGAGSDKALRF